MLKKIKSLDEGLVENPKWTGIAGHCAGAVFPESIPEVGNFLYTKEAGGEGWVVAAQKNKKRNTCTACPTQGAPCLIKALDADFVIYLVPILAVCDKGICFENYDAWCDTPPGKLFVPQKVVSIVLKQGAALYIPAGYHYGLVHVGYDKILVQADQDEESDTENAKALKSVMKGNEVGHAMTFPLYCMKWISSLEPKVKTCITAMNEITFKSKAKKPMWQIKADCFRKYFA